MLRENHFFFAPYLLARKKDILNKESSLVLLTRAELRAPLVLAVAAVVDGVADEVVVDADAVVLALKEAFAAALLLRVLECRDEQLEAVV